MSRAFAISMTRPHEQLGLPQPFGRRLPDALVLWNVLIAIVTLFSVAGYIVQVNRAASQGFSLREQERSVEGLRIDVMALEDRAAKLSSIEALNERALALGLVAVDQFEFVNPASKSYALAK